MHKTDHTVRCHLADETATLAFGARLARELGAGMTFYLEGDLGAGKTTLVCGCCARWGTRAG
jgi:tRNA threonylcarbamoyladenosine biosynthesis protein TsaE